jgi:alpha-tubulin suppressor-like RCC1 family protein
MTVGYTIPTSTTLNVTYDSLLYNAEQGSLWMWGYNSGVELGINDTGNRSSPVNVGFLANWKQLALSAGGGAAIKTDSSLWVWGYGSQGALGLGNNNNQSSPVQLGSGVTWQTVFVNNASAAIKTDGTLWTWGSGYIGELGIGVTGSRSSPVQVPSTVSWSQVAIGSNNMIALKTNGTLWAWGYNGLGELGLGDIAHRSSPVQIGSGTNWSRIVAGADHMYALTTSGALYTWGYNANGELGLGDTLNRSSPVQVGTLTNWSQIAAGTNHTLAVKTDGTLWVWGWNFLGGLGLGLISGLDPGADKSSPTQLGSLTTWQSVACAQYASAAIKTDGTMWTWGGDGAGDNYGVLGNNSDQNTSSPVQVGTLTSWVSLFKGNRSSTMGAINAVVPTITVNSTVDMEDIFVPKEYFLNAGLYTWGLNFSGALGANTSSGDRSTPAQVGSLTNWKATSTSRAPGTIAVKTDGTLWSWGNNKYGNLGQNNLTNYSSPLQVGTLSNWKLISSGWYHSLAIKTDGTLWAWGYNHSGQLGLRDLVHRSSPTQVGSLTNWKFVSAGTYHTVAIKTDGTLWVWGSNYTTSFLAGGQLGLGDMNHRSSPVQVGSGTDWKLSGCGNYHTVAIKTSGTLWSWGYNDYGQLGQGDFTGKSSPIQVGSASDWKLISCGYYHTYGIKTNGTLWGFGLNAYGELGLNNTLTQSTPVQVGNLTNWKQIRTAGYYNALAIKTDGTLWAWGWSNVGELGLGTVLHRSSPIQVGSLTNWKQVHLNNWGSMSSAISSPDLP